MQIVNKIFSNFLGWLTELTPSLIFCAFVILIGFVLDKVFSKIIIGILLKTGKFNEKVINLFATILRTFIYIIVIFIVLEKFGINLTSIAAMFSALSIALTIAAKDTLSNLAKGIQIYFTRPFKRGDYIQIGTVSGIVRDIQIFYTRLIDDDNKIILIPNKMAADDKIINFSLEKNRRAEFQLSVPSKNAHIAKDILNNFISSSQDVLKDPEPSVSFSGFDDNTVKFLIYVFVSKNNYKKFNLTFYEEVNNLFIENNIFS